MPIFLGALANSLAPLARFLRGFLNRSFVPAPLRPRRGQTATEYLLLIGAVIVFVLVVVAIVRTYIIGPSLNESANLTNLYHNLTTI